MARLATLKKGDWEAFERHLASALGRVEFVLEDAGQELHLREVATDVLAEVRIRLGIHGNLLMSRNPARLPAGLLDRG